MPAAQGGEEAGLAALTAWRAGGAFADWKRAFRDRDVRPFASRRVPDGRLRLPQLAAWPTLPLTSTTVPVIGARSTVLDTVCCACVTCASAEATEARA